MHQYQEWDRQTAQDIIAQHLHLEGPLLPILHALQHEFGYVDAEAEELIAKALNQSQAEVRGAISFYHDFERTKPARHRIKICRAEACQSMGCEAIVAHIKHRHHITIDDDQHKGTLTFKSVYCLGNCALGPSLMIDEQIIGRVDATLIDHVVSHAENSKDLSLILDEVAS